MKPLLAQSFARQGLVNRQLADDVLKYRRRQGVTGALERTIAARFEDGRRPRLLRGVVGRVGSRVAWGAQDRIIPPQRAAGLPAGVRVNGRAAAGHMAPMEAAVEVNRVISSFVTGVP